MDNAQTWKACFTEWPEDVPRRGILITTINEQIPFSTFLTSPTMLLLERTTPDTAGTRKVLLPYGNISMLKIAEVINAKSFAALGFAGPAPK
ncbi:MAG: hypothetical protein WDZ59_17245 [Pirellulales bacterium]